MHRLKDTMRLSSEISIRPFDTPFIQMHIFCLTMPSSSLIYTILWQYCTALLLGRCVLCSVALFVFCRKLIGSDDDLRLSACFRLHLTIHKHLINLRLVRLFFVSCARIGSAGRHKVLSIARIRPLWSTKWFREHCVFSIWTNVSIKTYYCDADTTIRQHHYH